MINGEINRLVEKSIETALSTDDLKKLESLLKMRVILDQAPQTIIVQDYSQVYDRTILSTIKKKKTKPPLKKVGRKPQTPEQKEAAKRTKDIKRRNKLRDKKAEAKLKQSKLK